MAGRKRKLTDADRRAAAKVRELWAAFKKKNPGISQEAAAQRMGIGQSAFSQFLRAEVPMRVQPIMKFARLFGIDPREIRTDIEALALNGTSEVREPAPDYGVISEEALEIARAFDELTGQTKERVREHVFMQAVIDKSFPWLRTGRPVSNNYAKFEKWHSDNSQAQLTLEAARLARGKTK